MPPFTPITSRDLVINPAGHGRSRESHVRHAQLTDISNLDLNFSDDEKNIIGGHLRSHFLPCMAEGKLISHHTLISIDIASSQPQYGHVLPSR